MFTKLTFSRNVLGCLIACVTLLIGTVNFNTVRAQDPNNDGRINQTPWVNSFGAVAVYCIDGNGQAGSTFDGGGIAVLNANGQRLLFASDVAIQQAQAALNSTVTASSTSLNNSNNDANAVPMCINTNLAARGQGVLTETIVAQQQADAIVAKYNLSETGRLVTPDLSKIQFSLDTFDHQLLEISNQEAAFTTRTAGLLNLTATAQNNAQLLEQANAIDSQINVFLATVDGAIKRGAIIGSGLNGTSQAIQNTIAVWRASGLSGSAGGTVNSGSTGTTGSTNSTANGTEAANASTASDFDRVLASMGAIQGRVGGAAAGINNVTAGLQNVRTRLNDLRSRLATLNTTLNGDPNGAPGGMSTLTAYLNEADSVVRTVDGLIRQPCNLQQQGNVPGTVLLARQGVYSLYALGAGNFILNTVPDASGRTVLGHWNMCSQS